MIELASGLLLLLTTISLYVLILNRKNIIVLFVLIPVLLVSSVYTGYAIYALQGTPVESDLPLGVKVEIAYMEASKPWIYLLLRVDNASEATYYKIPYSEEMKRQLEEAQNNAEGNGEEEAQGEFQKSNNSDFNSDGFVFVQNPDWVLPEKEEAPRTVQREVLFDQFFRQ